MAKKPTEFQAKFLRMIARSPLTKTHTPEGIVWALTDGTPVPDKCANALIKNRWVVGQKDGMFDDAQTYVALKP